MDEVYLFLAAVLGSLFLLGPGGQIFLRMLGYVPRVLFQVSAGVSWWLARREEKRKFACTELLARYESVIQQGTQGHTYFAHLIREGIRPRTLQGVLEENFIRQQQTEYLRQESNIRSRSHQDVRLNELCTRHEALLTEGLVQLERLRFREDTLGGLITKLRSRYEL
ncbi:MAG: hypothetical protein QF752_05705 [Planctomycetota bacterium]|jgi:hypothetical protein|nr:hypothetical protein [Planctomycetota bacterium]